MFDGSVQARNTFSGLALYVRVTRTDCEPIALALRPCMGGTLIAAFIPVIPLRRRVDWQEMHRAHRVSRSRSVRIAKPTARSRASVHLVVAENARGPGARV